MVRLLLVLAASLFASTVWAATIQVDVFTDSTDPKHQTCGSSAGDCTLRAALAIAKADDTLLLARGTHTIDSTLVINKNITVLGTGLVSITTGKPDVQLLRLEKPTTTGVLTVSLDKLAFSNGFKSGGFGGAITTPKDVEIELSITNCSFENNKANAGGALYWTSPGSLLISDSLFAKNVGAKGAGALFLDESKSKISILDSTFRDNTATVGEGGAIASRAMTVNIEHSSFFRNSADVAGAIAVRGIENGISSSLELNFVTIARNDAGKFGGITLNAPAFMAMANTLIGENKNGDCDGAVKSRGFNMVEAPGACTVKSTGDISDKSILLSQTEDIAAKSAVLLSSLVPQCFSAALDHACNSASTDFDCTRTSDSLGFARPVGKARDIGAVEAPVLGASVKVEAPASANLNEAFAYVVTMTNESGRALKNASLKVTIPAFFAIKSKPPECTGTGPFFCAVDEIKAKEFFRATFSLVSSTAGADKVTVAPFTESCLDTPLTNTSSTIEIFALPTPTPAEKILVETPVAEQQPAANLAEETQATEMAKQEDNTPLASVDELFVRHSQLEKSKGCSAVGDGSAALWIFVALFLAVRRRTFGHAR